MASDPIPYRLADVARITSGKRPPDSAKEATEKASVPIVGGGGISGFTNQALFAHPVLVTGRVGTLGKLFAIDGPTWPSDNALVVIADEDCVDTNFLRYALQSVIHQTVGMNRGAANPLVTQKDLAQLPIPRLSIDVQRRIAGVLRTIDDRIDNLRQTNVVLEAIAQALFKSWFVDFDPVHAKAEGREPEGMGAATAALFPSEFEDSELGPIPAGWRASPFGSLLKHAIGGDWGTENPTDRNTEKIAVIRGTDIPSLRTQLEGRVPIRFTTEKKVASRKLAVGDIVVEVSGGSKGQPTGRSLYLTAEIIEHFDCEVVPASFCRKFSPSTRQIGLLLAQHMDFIYAAGRTWEYQNQSTGIANFQTKYFLETEKVVVPCDKVLNAFFELVQPMIERMRLFQANRLACLRDTLLPRLLSGKILLPEVEALSEESPES